MRCKFSTKAW